MVKAIRGNVLSLFVKFDIDGELVEVKVNVKSRIGKRLLRLTTGQGVDLVDILQPSPPSAEGTVDGHIARPNAPGSAGSAARDP